MISTYRNGMRSVINEIAGRLSNLQSLNLVVEFHHMVYFEEWAERTEEEKEREGIDVLCNKWPQEPLGLQEIFGSLGRIKSLEMVDVQVRSSLSRRDYCAPACAKLEEGLRGYFEQLVENKKHGTGSWSIEDPNAEQGVHGLGSGAA
jgi:hypothetical protein